MKLIGCLIVVALLLGAAGFLPQIAYSKEIQWQSFADGMARGKSENKKVFLHFYAAWCAACKSMEENTFKDPGVIAFLNKDYVPVKVDVDRNKKISRMFKVKALPDTWFIAKNNKIIGHRLGYISPEKLKVLLQLYMEEDPGL
jgi:thiol:disulfide interchange protein